MPQLLGLGAATTLAEEVNGFLSKYPDPTYKQVVDLLALYPSSTADTVGRLLVAGGAAPGVVSAAVKITSPTPNWGGLTSALALLASAGAVFHGYRRNQSIGWALLWGAAGAVFPVVTTTVAIAQGYGRRPA